jgi:hypothetical protein
MKLLTLAAMIGWCATGVVRAEETVAVYTWQDTPGARAGELFGEGDQGFLRIRNTNSTQLRVQLLRIEKPPVTSQLYALRGDVRYEGVEGEGFLEMWNIFSPSRPGGPEGQYFSRTLDSSGELGQIAGSSDWRRFSLPFNMVGSATPPTRLEVNLILPGRAQVDLKGVQLLQFAGTNTASGSVKSWWSEREAGFLGGTAGTLLGCLGALIGSLAARRKAQWFVIGASRTLIAFGLVLAIVFVIALTMGQPFWVWYLPGLLSLLLLTLFPGQLRRFNKSYAEAEMRRMVAADSVT